MSQQEIVEKMLDQSWFGRGVETVARELIGTAVFVAQVGGTIVETEAYDAQDPAAHSFRGPTARNAAMFGPAGRAYVYRSYGLHWCMNFTCGHGSGVLIRAIEPLEGIEIMQERRGVAEARLLCSGPGRLCQALGVDMSFNSLPLDQPPFELREKIAHLPVIACPRIGISVAKSRLRRFCAVGSPYLSKRVPGS
jgi:DNA-3-methyladenine glycosylase